MRSIWEAGKTQPQAGSDNRLDHDITTDVLIVGAGLAGLLCGYMLKQAGVPCVVVEANEIAGGVTKNTTAKITAQHGLLYADLIQKKGIQRARQNYQANTEAIETYRAMAERFECDFEEKTAYVYCRDDRKKLEREADAYQKIGIPMNFSENPPLPVATVGALGMQQQAQFHPLMFLRGFSAELDIYEHTKVADIKGNKAYTHNAVITAKHMILATHYPLVNIPGLYFLKMHQHRSYVLALEKGPALDGMYIDEQEDGYSFRNYKNMLLVGGCGHKTGKQSGGFKALRELAQCAYPNAREMYAWATQDCMTLDGLPYIGVHRSSTPNLYVATGFNKWGMTGCMIAATTLTDLIVKGESAYADLFFPQRSMLHPQLLANVGGAVAGLLSFGKRCPHMGCALKWNAAERTWDCSCHGSRFDQNGRVIDNPAKRGISVE